MIDSRYLQTQLVQHISQMSTSIDHGTFYSDDNNCDQTNNIVQHVIDYCYLEIRLKLVSKHKKMLFIKIPSQGCTVSCNRFPVLNDLHYPRTVMKANRRALEKCMFSKSKMMPYLRGHSEKCVCSEKTYFKNIDTNFYYSVHLAVQVLKIVNCRYSVLNHLNS